MKELAARIERVRVDLSVIQQELTTGAAWEEKTGSEPDPAKTPDVDLATLKQLKSVVDEMRHFLWWLLQEIALESGATVDESLQNFRFYRAAAMLRSLRAGMEDAPAPDPGEVRSFVDALQSIATVVVDRHMNGAQRGHGRAEKTEPN